MPIYYIEVVVPYVKLTEPEQLFNTCPICVCLRFPNLFNMQICEDDNCNIDRRYGSNRIQLTTGESCLFDVDPSKLCKTIREFHSDISVYRRVRGGPETRLVGQTRLDFDRIFTEILMDPDQPDRSRHTTQELLLYRSGYANPVGKLEVSVKMISYGELIVSNFTQNPFSENHEFSASNVFIPTKAKVSQNCLNTCLTRCCNQRNFSVPQNTAREDCDCNKDIEQQIYEVNCILNTMLMIKELFMKSMTQDKENNQVDKDKGKCAFDPNCPIIGCPFKIDEPITQFVDRVINGQVKYPAKQPEKDSIKEPVKKSKKRTHIDPFKGPTKSSYRTQFKGRHMTVTPEVIPDIIEPPNEIVDDADLFIVNVRAPDPCRYRVPVYKSQGTQYSLSDIPVENLPRPKIAKKKLKSKKIIKKTNK